nr:MAG TPA: holin [Caudoviricetes sp.]
MDIIKEVISQYGTEILGGILTALATYIGLVAKKIANKILNDKTKKSVAKTVVSAIEQCYKDLNGPEKLEKAIEAATKMLNEQGITCTEVELRLLLESALAEFNKVFEKDSNKVTEKTAEFK